MVVQYIYAGTEILSGIMCWVAAIYLFVASSQITEQYRSLGAIELGTGLLMISDGLAWYYNGIPGGHAFMILNISNFLVFTCNAVIPASYGIYILYSLKSEDRDVRVLYLLGGISIFTELFLLLSYPKRFIYWIDPVTNLYQRGPGFAFWSVLFFLPVIVASIFVFRKRHAFNRRRFKVIVMFAILPIAAVIINVFVGMSLSNYAICFCVLIMFMQVLQDNVKVMVEQKALIKKREDEISDMMNRIALSQIKPHFLYNALNSICVLCDEDKEQAKKVTNDLADYLRQNLESMESREPIPFEKELEHTRTYIEIEKVRFVDRFDVEYRINATDFTIPALTVQPLVENAVKHGLCKKKMDEKGHLVISSDDCGDHFKVTIEDNGVGFDVAEYEQREVIPGHHIGIRNVRKRVQLMENAELKVHSEIGKGTRIDIIIPK
jgi:sensor histidine kinase YesM